MVTLCTRPCSVDGDCVDAWGGQEGYCESGWCRAADGSGGPCRRDAQCGYGRCQRTGSSAPGTCVYPGR
jgi:hypothetical protein